MPNKPAPKFKAGEEISWQHSSPSGATVTFEGTIMTVDLHEERYLVSCPQYGEGVFPCPFDKAIAA